MGQEMYLEDFIRMSKYAGMHNDYVQAGGGNTSVKLDETRMAIKASGYQLTDMGRDNGYSIVNYPSIAAYFNSENKIPHDEKGSNDVLNRSLMEGKRPSIETFLHAITKRFTLHSHPTCVNIMTARMGGMGELKKMFPDSLAVGYATPGILLADKYFAEVQGESSIIFLKNHGVVVTADSADEAIMLHKRVVRTLNAHLGMDDTRVQTADKIYGALYSQTGNIVYCVRDTEELQEMTARFGGTGWNYAFAPDCLVYCGKRILDLDSTHEAEEFVRAYMEHAVSYGEPKIAYRGGHYYILAPNLRKAHEIESVLQFCAKVCLYNAAYEMDYISESSQNEILNLDSEKYRQNMK